MNGDDPTQDGPRAAGDDAPAGGAPPGDAPAGVASGGDAPTGDADGRGAGGRGRRVLGRWTAALANPEARPEIEAALARRRESVPVLWLLGKTGAGKSSVVQRLTGDSRAQIGNGFEPCTATASLYDHPAGAPVMRFLDTRGLGETDYDPAEDLAACRGASHALLVLTRVDDTGQGAIGAALGALGAGARELPVVHLHTALHAVPDDAARERAIRHNARTVSEALGRAVPSVRIDFSDPDDGLPDPDVGLGELRATLVDLVPALAEALGRRDASDAEHGAFLRVRREVLGYASAAAAVDAVPGIGLVGVPTVQGKLLHALAARYGHPWNRSIARDFLGALGTTFLYRYAAGFLVREAAKFVPVYGQSAGAAAAATLSFAATYALGRAASLYLYRRLAGERVDTAELQAAFRAAFASPHTDPARADADTDADADAARELADPGAGDAPGPSRP